MKKLSVVCLALLLVACGKDYSNGTRVGVDADHVVIDVKDAQ